MIVVFAGVNLRWSGRLSRHAVSFWCISCNLLERSPGLVLELLSVYMLLRISPRMTESRHNCLNVETLKAGDPG